MREQHPMEEALGYAFEDAKLLEEALTHASYRNEAAEVVSDYERLEFLGDAVFELAVSELLFRRLPQAQEGRLTQLRARLVSARSLARRARALGVGDHLRIGRGEERTGGRDRGSILADVLEALAAAVYVDGGYEAAASVIRRLMSPRLEDVLARDSVKDAKSRLQEWSQRGRGLTPDYALIEISGPQHDAWFEAEVRVGDELVEKGSGRTKKAAEQAAAQAALAALDANDALEEE